MKKAKTAIELVSDARMDVTFSMTPELDHALLIASKAMRKEIPSGTVRDANGVDRCMMCHRTAGESAFYCKYCGQKLRETPDWAKTPYQE